VFIMKVVPGGSTPHAKSACGVPSATYKAM
jgi:hypothetical protein